MEGKKLRPFGDKLVLEEIEDKEGVLDMGADVRAKVVAVGDGIPYGRGEFYAPVAKEGMVVIVPREDWTKAPKVRWNQTFLRVVHERQCLVGIVDD